MKKSIITIVFSLLALCQTACKKEKMLGEQPHNTKKIIETTSLLSSDFCGLVSREPDLHFGLDRDTDQNYYVFTKTQLNNGLFNFHTYFKYYDSSVIQNLDSSKQTLSVDELIDLYSVLKLDTSVHYNPDSNYSALRLHFGMEGKKIILIYEPIVLKPTLVPKECSVTGTNQYFRIDASGNFVSVNSFAFSSLTNNLRAGSSKIHIIHPFNSGIYSFINNSDASGDIRSNIISFQQVVKMYCDNTQGSSGTDRINFTIVANQNTTLSSNFRMHVVPNFRIGLSTPVSGTYKNYAADFLNLCPTLCNNVLMNYYD